MITFTQLAQRMKADIVADVEAGIVPRSIAGFSELHDYVDANCYGGADELFGEVVTESATDQEHQAKIDIVNSITTPAMDIVDAWIKAGGIDTALTLARIRANPKAMTKVTVYRPREQFGLGPPEAFLGDDHPKHGDWVQSAKSIQPVGVDPHMMLHQMGRDFLIYSMYHVREPRFMGYAVENFSAACKVLGYSLPLKESDAVWLTYLPSELDPASPAHNRAMLKQIGRVFGTKAAHEQAAALGIEWPRKVTPEQLAEAMKREILEDVQKGVVPRQVASFSQLHDFVDANCYGGTEALLDELDDAAPDTDEGHSGALSQACDICNPAMDIVDAWIKAGGISEASKSWMSRTKRKPGKDHFL